VIKLDQEISIPGLNPDVSIKRPEYGFGLHEMKGWRPTQEDAAVACWYAKNAFTALSPQEIGKRLWTTYKLINQHCCKPGFAGSTASTTVYDGQGNLITATLGDSVAFAVVYNKENQVQSVTRLNQIIHHPNYDRERFEKDGGVIISGRAQGAYGSLALSRALGDYEYRKLGVCDDAHINIATTNELSSEDIGTIKIITTCDGFTDPASQQTKEGHEQWLFDCLNSNLENMSESQLADFLVLKAFNAKSQDNISVLVQTVLDYPFLVGIYDGHGGVQTSSYCAQHINEVFVQQCNLDSRAYAKQDLSADYHFEIYCRDNQKEW
jgi:YD repeat-containing protein